MSLIHNVIREAAALGMSQWCTGRKLYAGSSIAYERSMIVYFFSLWIIKVIAGFRSLVNLKFAIPTQLAALHGML